VRILTDTTDRWEQVVVHAKTEPGRFRIAPEHIPKEKVSAVERGTDAMLRQIATMGPHTRQWAEAMTQARGVKAVRVLVGLKNLAGKHPTEALGLPRSLVPRGLSAPSWPRRPTGLGDRWPDLQHQLINRANRISAPPLPRDGSLLPVAQPSPLLHSRLASQRSSSLVL
jgi:hypothetical protein